MTIEPMNGDARAAGAGQACQQMVRLDVDQRHPFYFDHPLDHVPGILMVAGLLDLARDVAGGPWPGQRIRLALTFALFGELDQDVTLHCTSPGGGGWQLRADQCGRTVCEGSLAISCDQASLPTSAVPSPAPVPVPAPAELVHRAHTANIMIGELTRPEPGVFQAAVLTSEALPHCGEHRAAEQIIEAARQMCLMLGHVAHARSQDSPVLWLEVGADLVAALPRELPLALRWRETPPDRAWSRFELDLIAAEDGRRLGTVTNVSRTLSRRAYDKARFVGSQG